jgi:hypothetical protein
LEDALADYAIEITEIPITPNRLWELVEERRKKEEVK